MKKQYLLAPGPTPVPPNVLQVMSMPILHHRAPAYKAIFEEVREGLKYLFQTQEEVLVFAASGTGAMEGSIANLFSPGDKVITVNGGKFGERWGQIAAGYGLEVLTIAVPWGTAVKPQEIADLLAREGNVRGVLIQASETSTGVMHPVKEIAEVIKSYDQTILVVDAITGVGVFDLPMDAWGLDVVVTGSQKALMLPPGLAFAAVSQKAWGFNKQSTLPRYYFDFAKELKNAQKGQNAYTPAVSLIIGLREVLKMIREEGLENVFARHERLASATRAGVQALGLELYAPDAPSNAVTAVIAPEGVDGQDVVKVLRTTYGVTIAGGQDQAKGKIFRLAHLGYVDDLDVLTGLSALEMALMDLGYDLNERSAVRAAQMILKAKK
ncbi:MAG: alanine--glyoxylate aminotransferase family protein [Deltaproteobacteria bacterium]|nr:alanine--glyoxylate aminotransferase family protein [Candidatus Anaeroferrophillus wilburensis]MBN2890097.1 alanine--glyoxylate aminotransferase family protein [Deltaproteobacteria bacterium]